MESGARIYIPGLIKIGFGIQKLIVGMHIQTRTQTESFSSEPISVFEKK